MPPIRLHDLRHGAATLSLAVGTDMKYVSAMLRHSSIGITSDIYAAALPEMARSAAEAAVRLVPRKIVMEEASETGGPPSVPHLVDPPPTGVSQGAPPLVKQVGRVGLEPTTHGL